MIDIMKLLSVYYFRLTMYTKLPRFSHNLKCAIGVLYLSITEFTPNFCQSKVQGFCPDDWTLSQYSGTCVSVRSDFWNQSTARSKCKGLGGDIVTILSSDMNGFLHDYLKTKSGVGGVWIGLRRQSGEFRWLDSNDEPAYFNWYIVANEPSGEDCVQINNFGAKDYKAWMDGNCDLQAAYICEKLQSQWCPFGWIFSSPSWSCIKLFLNELTWNDSRDACKSNQADLLVIQDDEMNNFLQDVLSEHKYDYWIGLNDRKTEGVYRWLDNDKEVLYVKMGFGLSNDGDCGQVRRPYDGWSLNLCGQRKKFICERMTEQSSPQSPEGEKYFTELPGEDTNVNQSSEGNKNFTKKQEGIDRKAPSMLKAYLASLVFVLVVIGFFLIPQCTEDMEQYRDSIQEEVKEMGEDNIKAEYFEDAVFENLPYGESSVDIVQGDPTFSRTKILEPNQSVYSVTRADMK